MARPREFDTEQVLRRAMDAFWRNGYEATSLADLMEATGLQKGSIYKAFGDKRSLFLETLRAYQVEALAFHREVLSGDLPPAERLRRWLGESLRQFACSPDRRGCFAVNASVELAPDDPEVCRCVAAGAGRIRDLLTDVLADGQANGSFRDDLSAPDLATLLLVMLTGLTAALKGPVGEEDGKRVIETVLQAIQRPG